MSRFPCRLSPRVFRRRPTPSSTAWPPQCASISDALHDGNGIERPGPLLRSDATPDTSTSKTFTNSGSASGIGDVTFRVKVRRAEPAGYSHGCRDGPARSVRRRSVATRFGSLRGPAFLAVSGGGRVSPHLNIGYQWNSKSILASGRQTFRIQYHRRRTVEAPIESAGREFRGGTRAGTARPVLLFARRRHCGDAKLTLVFDYLGQVLINTPRVFATRFSAPTGRGYFSSIQWWSRYDGPEQRRDWVEVQHRGEGCWSQPTCCSGSTIAVCGRMSLPWSP